MDEDFLLGEWDKKLNCFWFGANDCEWIAWNGSNQVFVYPCDEYPNPPSKIIQHTERIESLEDFTRAIQGGIVYEASYTKVKVYWQG